MKCRRGQNAIEAGAPATTQPGDAQVTWRVIEPGNSFDVRDIVHEETILERKAWKSFRKLRRMGFPVLVTCWQIYRVQIKPRDSIAAERFVFVEAYSQLDACARVAAGWAGFARCTLSNARGGIVAVKSYESCLRDGLSADRDLRLFEIAWSSGKVTTWVREPMFWLAAPSMLTRKWSHIQQDTLQ